MKSTFAAALALSALLFAQTEAKAQTLLLNGDFEDVSFTTLADGSRRFTGWTERRTVSGYGLIALEGSNGLSSFDIRADRFDGPTSGAPDPYFPYQSETEPRLDHIAALRPGAITLSSFGEFVSDQFASGKSFSLDVWRESTGAVSQVSLFRASDNTLLKTFSASTPAQQWARITLDTTSFGGEGIYAVLHGGTTQSTFGWLTLFDNATIVPVPEPASGMLLVMGLGVVTWLRCRQKRTT